MFAIEDSWTGLDPAIIDRVFEPLLTTKPDGMGMGLTICRSIIEVHHGRLWASQNADQGTTFQFTVTLATDAGSS